MISGTLNPGNRPLDDLLNWSVARLHSPWLTGFDLICNKDIYMSALVS